MTKEEKLELINKIGTLIDGAESYVRELYDAEESEQAASILDDMLKWDFTGIREHLQQHEDRVNRQREA